MELQVKQITGDAVKYTLADKNRVLLHVCNDKGVMGSGIALQIKNEMCGVYDWYKNQIKSNPLAHNYNLPVRNLIAQKGYRGCEGDYTNKCYLDYDMLHIQMSSVVSCEMVSRGRKYSPYSTTEIVIPHKMGADRAGGDWGKVLEIVKGHLGIYPHLFRLTIVRLEDSVSIQSNLI